MSKITLVTFVDELTQGYADFMYKISSRLLSNSNEINWLYSTLSDKVKLHKPWKVLYYENIEIPRGQLHQYLLNKSYEMIPETDYVILCDCDIVFLYNEWDVIIVNKLNDVDIFGAPYSQDDKKRYQKFPNTRLFCYNYRKLKDIKLNFNCWIYKNGIIKDELSRKLNKNDAEILNKSEGSVFRYDTGCNLPFIAYDNKLSSECLKVVEANCEKVQLLPRVFDIYNTRNQVEYHYNGKIFATHKHGCHKNAFNYIINKKRENGIILWEDKIIDYMKKEYKIVF